MSRHVRYGLPAKVWCEKCNREIDFTRLADCHPFGVEKCAFTVRGAELDVLEAEALRKQTATN